MTLERVFFAIIALLILTATFMSVDYILGEDYDYNSNVIEKWYEEERRWTTTTTTIVNKTPVVTVQHHFDDEDWMIRVEGNEIGGGVFRKDVEISEREYNETYIGDIVVVTLTHGKFTNWRY